MILSSLRSKILLIFLYSYINKNEYTQSFINIDFIHIEKVFHQNIIFLIKEYNIRSKYSILYICIMYIV